MSAHGAAMLVRRELLLELGGFDETFFLEWEDLDLCWRAWLRGHGSVYVPDAWLRHRVGGATAPGDLTRRLSSSHHNLMRFALKCLPARRGRARRSPASCCGFPAHPRLIAPALARVARELPEILRAPTPDRARRRAHLDWLLAGMPGMRRRALVVSNDHVGKTMAGPGIRSYHFAVELARDFDVTLVVPFETDLADEPFEVVHDNPWDPARMSALVRGYDVVVTQRLPVPTMRALARLPTRVDLRPLRAGDAGAARLRRARGTRRRTAARWPS